MVLQVEELNIDMEPGDIVDDILGEHTLMQHAVCHDLNKNLQGHWWHQAQEVQ